MNSNFENIREILVMNFSYFNKLLIRDQEKFILRLQNFIDRKRIVSRAGFDLSFESKVLVAAPAIQLTLGLDYYLMDYFDEILVYPNAYKNPHTGNLHKGETNLAGFMCFSYPDLISGFLREHDNHNLGLHEFAHALRFSSLGGNNTDDFFENYFPKLISIGEKEYIKLKTKKSSIFRAYGGANINEFFSVIVEHFFESPLQFKLLHPELFKHLCILLNQIPAPHEVILNVREDLLKIKNEKIFTDLLASSSTYGGLIPILFLLSSISLLFFIYLRQELWVSVELVVLFMILIFITFLLPRWKRILFFKEGVLLSWFVNGLFRKEPLFVEYERMVSVRMIGEMTNSKNILKGCSELQMTYYYKKEFKTLNLQCNLSENIANQLVKILKSHNVHVMLRPSSATKGLAYHF